MGSRGELGRNAEGTFHPGPASERQTLALVMQVYVIRSINTDAAPVYIRGLYQILHPFC